MLPALRVQVRVDALEGLVGLPASINSSTDRQLDRLADTAEQFNDARRTMMGRAWAALSSLHYYQDRRLNPPTKSKWESRLMTGIEYCRLSAAIQTSFAGIGLPAAFSSSRMAA